MKAAVFDTNLLVDWLSGRGPEWPVGEEKVHRYLVATVLMELRAGATSLKAKRAVDDLEADFRSMRRLKAPSVEVHAQAGDVLLRLRKIGVEVRRASLVNDVLIALTAKSFGATVYTADLDFETIRRAVRFDLEIVPRDDD